MLVFDWTKLKTLEIEISDSLTMRLDSIFISCMEQFPWPLACRSPKKLEPQILLCSEHQWYEDIYQAEGTQIL